MGPCAAPAAEDALVGFDLGAAESVLHSVQSKTLVQVNRREKQME
jgi:hypothetical protein